MMMLAAFATFFALVCPVAPTPMGFQKHGSAQVATAPIALNAAIMVALSIEFVPFLLSVPLAPSAAPNDLNCVRNC